MDGSRIPPVEGADQVFRSDIRRRLEVFHFDCPLHYDPDMAQLAGYRDVIAPTTMPRSRAFLPLWHPGDPEPHVGEPIKVAKSPIGDIPAPGTHRFATEIRAEFAKQPIYPGDRLSSTKKLIKIEHKRLSVGDGAFLVFEAVYRKQSGETVGTE